MSGLSTHALPAHMRCYNAGLLNWVAHQMAHLGPSGTDGSSLQGEKTGRNEVGGKSKSGVRHPTMTCMEWVSANRCYQSCTFSV